MDPQIEIDLTGEAGGRRRGRPALVPWSVWRISPEAVMPHDADDRVVGERLVSLTIFVSK